MNDDEKVQRLLTALEREEAVHIWPALREICADVIEDHNVIVDALLAQADPAKMTRKAAHGLAIVTFDGRDDLPHWLEYVRRAAPFVGLFGSGIQAVLQNAEVNREDRERHRHTDRTSPC